MTTWKNKERDVAKRFGGNRTYLSGGVRQLGDVDHPRLYIEIKYRKEWAIFNLFNEVEQLAARDSKTPLLVLSKRYSRDYIVVCRLSDLKKIAEELK